MTTCITINVATPENVTSNLLTAVKGTCGVTCAITGTVRWTNSGGTASISAPLKIDVSGTQTTIATVSIAPYASTQEYSFNIPNIAPGPYTISAIPAGAAPVNITINPALIAATNITSNITGNACTAPCPATITATWANTGDVSAMFTPALTITGGTPPTVTPPYPPEPIIPGTPITHTFSLTNLVAAPYLICPNPP